MNATDIMKAAESRADAIGREPLPVVETRKCRRCKGSGEYTLASGAKGDCAGAGCVGGQVPATPEGRAIIQMAKADRELRRMRALWAGCRDMLRARHTRAQADEARRFMYSLEARAASVKAGSRAVVL